MINYDYTVTVTGNTAKLDKDIYLFRGNKNVHYYFAVKNASFNFKGSTDLIEKTNAINAAVTVIKPNGVEVANAIAEVENGKIHLKVTEDLIDEEVEVGDFDLVFDLFDDTDGAVTIPKVQGQFHVLERPCTTPISELVVTTNTTNEVDLAIADYAIATYAEPVTSTNADGTFAKKTWVAKEKITTAELNRMEEGIYNNSSQCKDIANRTDISTNKWFLKLLDKLGYSLSDLIERLPKVSLNGDLTGISADNYKNVTCSFEDEINDIKFNNYATLAWQGSGSLSYPKKNYKIKLFEDESRTKKAKKQFRDWHSTNNFHLKCNFSDCTNFMNNMMMHYVTKSYQYLTPLPREGARFAVDGFPIRLYVNDSFVGIYFWNLKQDDKIYNLNEEILGENGSVTQQADLCYQIGLNDGSNRGDNSGAFVYGNLNSGSNAGKNFANAHAEIDYYWEDRVWDKISNHPDVLYNTIQWVSESSNEEFKANLENYFDKEYLINYFLIMYTCAMTDSKGKNFNMLYFPDRGKWYATFWDMDNAFGTHYSCGTISYNVELNNFGCPSSRLFDKLWSNFKDEIVAKYKELRKTLFTTAQVEDSIDAVWGDVTTEWIDANYTAKYSNTNFANAYKKEAKSYVLDWASKRFAYMDTVMQYNPSTGGDTSAESLYYELGNINYSTGAPEDNTNKARTNYILIEDTSVTINSDVNNNAITHAVRCYDENYNYLGTGSSSSNIVINSQTLQNNTKYIKLVLISTSTINDGDLNDLLININEKYYKLSKDTIACTNIAFRNSTLELSESTSQTLDMILTPYNTTDNIIFSTSPDDICTIKNRVITPLKNGSCVITATCGTKTANCNVVVTGMPLYSYGYIDDYGNLVSSIDNAILNEYIEKQGTITINVATDVSSSINNLRLVEYDTNKNFIKRSYAKTYVDYQLDENTRYVKIGFSKGNGTLPYSTIFEGITIS